MRRRILLSRKKGASIDINSFCTFRALEDDFSVTLSRSACEYCINGDGQWIPLPAGTATAAVAAGGTLSFRNATASPDTNSGIGKFSCTKSCDLLGTIYALAPLRDYGFKSLMQAVVGLKTVSQTFLLHPTATNLPKYCFSNLFYQCTGLTLAPDIPFTNIGEKGCSYMFYGCSALTTAPAFSFEAVAKSACSYMFARCSALNYINSDSLPAETLAESCYEYMFESCSGLTKGPVLPAEKLVSNCYRRMWYLCSKLNEIHCYCSDTLSATYSDSWVMGVASSGTFYQTLSYIATSTSARPNGWTSVKVTA